MITYYLVGVAAVVVCWLGTVLRPAVSRNGVLKGEGTTFGVGNILATATVLVLFSGLRIGVGTDYPMYVRFFEIVDVNSYPNSLNTIPQEAGFVGLMFLVRGASEQTWVFFTICAMLTVLPLLWAIRRSRVNPVLAVFSYVFLTYYTTSLNAVRQSIAVSFVLLADTYRNRGAWVKFLLCSVIAIGFHYSAIIAIIVQLGMSRIYISMKTAVIVLLLGAPTLTFLLSQDWMRGLVVTVNARYGTYLDEADAAGTGTVLMALLRIALIFVLIAMMRRLEDVQRREHRWLSFALVSAVVLLLGSVAMEIARMEPYFGVFLVFLIPSILERLKHRNTATFLFAIFALGYFGIHTSAYNGLLPYEAVAGI